MHSRADELGEAIKAPGLRGLGEIAEPVTHFGENVRGSNDQVELFEQKVKSVEVFRDELICCSPKPFDKLSIIVTYEEEQQEIGVDEYPRPSIPANEVINIPLQVVKVLLLRSW